MKKHTRIAPLVVLLGLWSAVHVGASDDNVTLTAFNGELLSAWIDFNGNGEWTDPGERVFRNQLLLRGPNRLTFTVPRAAVEGVTLARFHLHGSRRGDTVTVAAFSRSLAPGPYVVAGGTVSAGGAGGVDLDSKIEAGNFSTVELGHSGGILNLWVDFNRNGSWMDPGERVLENYLVPSATDRVLFRVPPDAVEGDTWGRSHFHRQRPAGTEDGSSIEVAVVEDHRLAVVVPFRDGFESGDFSAWSKNSQSPNGN